MVERCVADAVSALEADKPVTPFAKLLVTDGSVRDIPCTEANEQRCYETLLARLKAEVEMGDIDAVALTARVTIPNQYGAPAPQGIRIHVEEKANRYEKISARLLYIPYELFASESKNKRTAMLHNPIAVGMPMEVFKRRP